ncbi:hypothetical protein J3Q64DRAFT_1010913 [Phycomyces blakesleeanus]|uniref:Uncharacterized protein n=1 Tax=Phycomyces blakesleeanus TaxID=4837 RepID=A0ABR3BBI8_PHYBL
MRELFIESTDSIAKYWDYLNEEVDFVTIWYARKSPAKEDTSRTRLLQLMVDKLYFRMKYEKVYVSPCCVTNQLILKRNSSALVRLFSYIKGCNGNIRASPGVTQHLFYLNPNTTTLAKIKIIFPSSRSYLFFF